MAGKISGRIDVVRAIANELNKRYSFDEIGEFASAFGLPTSIGGWSDEYEYCRKIVSKASDSVISEIAEDLGVAASVNFTTARQMPSIWQGVTSLRVFISHLSLDKGKATRLRDVMKGSGMSAFVAHEDIEPTLDWQVQIERALNNMELFVSLHTKGSASSFWMQQEIGYAVAKGVKIIAVRMEEDPTGFISKHQALSRGLKTAEQLNDDIIGLVIKDERLKARYPETVMSLDDDVPF